MIITHDRDLAAALPRRIALRDGRVGGAVTLASALRRSRARRRRGPAHASSAGRRCRPSASPSASRAWSPSSGSRSPRAPGCCTRSTAWGRICSRAAPGQTLGGDDATLPDSAAQTLRRVGGVQRVDSVRALDATVRRSDRIDPEETGGIAVDAADPGLLRTLGGSMVRGRFLNAATAGTRSVVLGAAAARQLGVDRPGALVYIAGRWWTVLGVMAPVELAPELDRAALDRLRRRGARARRRAIGEHRLPARRSVGRRARPRPGARVPRIPSIPRRSTSAGRRTRSRRAPRPTTR